jgi:hypothetical protein
VPPALTAKIVVDAVQETKRLTLPTKPLRLVSLMLDEEDPNARKLRVDGVAVRLKSRTVT